MDYRRQFHEIGLSAGLPMEPFDAWCDRFTEDTTVIWPIMKHGRMIGGLLFWHNTIHIAVRPEWHGRWLTQDIIDAYWQWHHTVRIVAMIKHADKRLAKLAQRFGFTRQNEDDNYQFFWKEPPCHPSLLH